MAGAGTLAEGQQGRSRGNRLSSSTTHQAGHRQGRVELHRAASRPGELTGATGGRPGSEQGGSWERWLHRGASMQEVAGRANGGSMSAGEAQERMSHGSLYFDASWSKHQLLGCVSHSFMLHWILPLKGCLSGTSSLGCSEVYPVKDNPPPRRLVTYSGHVCISLN